MAVLTEVRSDGTLLITGTEAQDVLIGGAGNDELNAFGSNSSLDGGPGSDLLLSLGADSTMVGGQGDDLLFAFGANNTASYSFTLNKEPAESKTLTFTDWLSEKYGKDFGDELPDFERGHHHHHHGHGKHHHDHGKHHHHHAKHDHHHGHHHKHGGCDDHHSHEWGLSQSFFAKNYAEWIREVVVADLLAQGLDLDVNGDGEIGVRLNAKDPDGTPWIEGLSDDELSAIFGDRDEVTLRHHHHGHDKWYSNSYTSSSSGDGDATISSSDGNDMIFGFSPDDTLRFDFTADAAWNAGMDPAEELAYLRSFFSVELVDPDGLGSNSATKVSAGDFSVTLMDQLFGDDNNDGVNDVFAQIEIFVNGDAIV